MVACKSLTLLFCSAVHACCGRPQVPKFSCRSFKMTGSLYFGGALPWHLRVRRQLRNNRNPTFFSSSPTTSVTATSAPMVAACARGDG
jgi:hypothetical protein